MSKKSYFGAGIEPACQYCRHSLQNADDRVILCGREGVVEAWHSCRRFDYEPLRRIPGRPAQLAEFSAEDMAVEKVFGSEAEAQL